MKKIVLITSLFVFVFFLSNGSSQGVVNEIHADPASGLSGDAN